MEAPVSASLGAMGSLIRKLDVLLGEVSEDGPDDHPGRKLRLPKAVRDGVLLLKETSTYLEDLSEVEDPPLTAKCWMKEVRELTYDIEDYIDSLAWPDRRTKIKTRFVCKVARLPRRKKVTWHEQVNEKITGFMVRAQYANERYKRYEPDFRNLRRLYAPLGPMLPVRCEEGGDLVIDGKMTEFINTLASDIDQQLKVVSIVGSGGLGKTTLVRVVYNRIKEQFNCRAFVRMVQKPNINTVLRDMFAQVKGQKVPDNCDDLDLTSEIRKYLQNKRYLIIIDDLWSASVWDIISHAFPESNQSRIIITTQIEDVALTCCHYNSKFMLEMKPLDVCHSKELFFNKCFGSESGCPKTLNEVANKIVELCGGLPLATINMASLLASHPILMEQWTYICDSLTSNLRTSSTSEGIRTVLKLSYNNLPNYLKTCLLYLNMYPEGSTIWKDDLVKQWVTEGFIDETEGRDMERVAGSYFDELTDRRLLQSACIKYSGETVSCTVHDSVHDLIAYESAEENFIIVIDHYRKSVELSDKVHRLCLHFSDFKYEKTPGNIRTSQVRSLTFFGFSVCMPSISNFKLLRVLNLRLSSNHSDDTLDLTGVSELLHLRYLKVVSDVCIQLPKHMLGLQYLVTLDMDTKVTAVPWDIIHLPCLLHLHLPFETNLIDWIDSMSSASVQRLSQLTNLKDLRLTCNSTPPPDHLAKYMDSLGFLLAGLGNLKSLALVPGSSNRNTAVRGPPEVTVSWDGFAPHLLQRLEWSLCNCIFPRVPNWIGELGNLCVLKISVKELPRDGVDILKALPALTALVLYVHLAPIQRICFGKEGFSVLRYFKVWCSAPCLKFEADAMRNLWKLKLGFNMHRVDQQSGTPIISIEHLSGLKEISAKIGGAGADTDAESALTATVSNHPSNPRIRVQLVDWIFYGDKGRKYPEEKECGRREQHHSILEEIEDEVSREDENKQADIRFITPSISSSRPEISDIRQMLMEAKYRWLRPKEIYIILQNYEDLLISPEPPNRPQSGSLFLFDRRLLRFFWKDGHNWKRKKDIMGAHGLLKCGEVHFLHCYHAQGDENVNFQKRTYLMLEEEYMHIALVHYLETKCDVRLYQIPDALEAQVSHWIVSGKLFKQRNVHGASQLVNNRIEKQSAMETAVSLTRSVLDRVLSSTGSALADKVPLHGVRMEVEFIRDELDMMRSFLKVSSAHDTDTETWVKQVRDLAYDVEDCLLDFALCEVRLQAPGFEGAYLLWKIWRRYPWEPIRALKASVEELNQRNLRYHIFVDRHQPQPAAAREEDAILPAGDHDAHSAELAFQLESDVVCRRGEKAELRELISGPGGGALRVVSVWGMGGMGKSSLARMVHNDPDLLDEFDCDAWVTVPHPLDGADVFARRLGKALGLAPGGHDVHEYLRGKRYLVVVDDLLSVEEWEQIWQVVLLDNRNGSRIIVTTRREDVAQHCAGHGGHVYELKPLGDAESMDLFCSKVHKSFDYTLPHDMKNQAMHILRRCRGLPLAISTIGGLLANRPKTSIEWRNAHEHLGAELESDLCNITNVIISSYDGLPYHLKAIFLYLSIFPENYKIRRTRLLRRWMAEGYISEKRDMSVEDVGERLFSELINRSMLEHSNVSPGVRVDRCWVHSMVLQIILSKSIEENQLFILSKSIEKNEIPQSKIRHLVVSRWKRRDEKLQNINLSYIRSLTIFGEYPASLISPAMRLLRVLDLEDTENLKNDDLTYIGALYHLRYLCLRGTNISELPYSLQNLLFLETLDIQDTLVRKLPPGIAKLEKLRYLHAGVKFTKELLLKMESGTEDHKARMVKAACLFSVIAPKTIGTLKNLHMLGVVNVGQFKGVSGRLGNLTNLQRLGVTGLTEEEGRELCQSIGMLSRLQRLEVRSHSLDFLARLDESALPKHLVSLRLCGNLNSLPEWTSKLNDLAKVKLLGTRLKQADIMHLEKLRNLAFLGMWQSSYIGESLHFRSETFPKLKFLDIEGLERIETVTIENGAMPELERLWVNNCPSVLDSSSGLSGVPFLLELNELLLKKCGDKENLIEILQGQVTRHPMRPKFLIGKSILPHIKR